MRWLPRDVSPNARAVWSDERWYSYAELASRAGEIAALVRSHARAGSAAPRPIVPLLGTSSFGLVAGYLGILGARAIPALIPEVSGDALAAVFAEVDADFALVDPARLDDVRTLGASRALPLDAQLYDQAELAGDEPDGLALLLYTSGSTATPRGVMLSARNLRASADAILAAAPVTAGDTSLVTLPLHHCYGLSVLHTHLARGAAIAIPGAAPGAVLATLDATAASGLPAVPSLIQVLLRDPAARARLAALRWIMVSGGKLPDGDLGELIAAAPRSRIHIRYGLTETTAAASFLPPGLLAAKRGSIGRGLPESPLRVITPSGAGVARNGVEIGEIEVRGEHVALGYLGGPADGFVDGAYRTGDLARIDGEGFVYVVGRTRTFVKTGSHRVAVEEIEEILARHPYVVEAAVVGIPHPTRGEALIALVVGDGLDPAELREHCARALPAFKLPLEYRPVSALPRTGTGKLDRRALLALVATQQLPVRA